jgi:hypothetical protein
MRPMQLFLNVRDALISMEPVLNVKSRITARTATSTRCFRISRFITTRA